MNLPIILSLVFIAQTCSGKLVRVDMTHNFAENVTAYWQMKDAFTIISRTRTKNPTYSYESNTFCASEHGGTHIDAPRHFAAYKHGVDEIPLERLIGKPFFIDVSDESSKNPDYQLDVSKIQQVEKQQGNIPNGAILLIYTGFSLKWNNMTDYFGGDPTNVSQYHFPGIQPSAAQWLVDNRKIASVGLDTPSIDYGQSTKFQSHVILYEQNIPGFENVDLSKMKTLAGKKNLLVLALPMKIKGGSGAPMRIVATYDDADDDKSSAVMTITSLVSVALATVLSIMFIW